MRTAKQILLRNPSLAGLTGGAVGYMAALTPSLLPHKLMFLLLLTALGTLTGYAVGTTASLGRAARSRACAAVRVPWLRQASASPALVWLLALVFTPSPCQLAGRAAVRARHAGTAARHARRHRPRRSPRSSSAARLLDALIRIAIERHRRAPRPNPPAGAVARGSGRARVLAADQRAATGAAVVLIVRGRTLGVRHRPDMADLLLRLGQRRHVRAEPTNLGINSGSAGSLTPWDTLGREGRFYVSNTMTPASIEAITGQPAQTPVRVYVGMQQGDTPEARTQLALAGTRSRQGVGPPLPGDLRRDRDRLGEPRRHQQPRGRHRRRRHHGRRAVLRRAELDRLRRRPEHHAWSRTATR